MRVGADAGVGIGNGFAVFILRPDRLAEIFEIHLVANAGARGHNAKILERRGAPAQELIPFLVALVFDFDVLLEAVLAAKAVDHDRVVNDEVDRNLRVDRVCRRAKLLRGIAHRGEVDHGRNAGEILHQHAGRAVGDLVADAALVLKPGFEGENVLLGDGLAVLMAQHVLKQDLEGRRQAGDVAKTVFCGCGQREIRVGLATDGECAF